MATLLEIRLLSALEVSETTANNGPLYDTLLLLLPHCLVSEIHVTADVIGQAGDSLFISLLYNLRNGVSTQKVHRVFSEILITSSASLLW